MMNGEFISPFFHDMMVSICVEIDRKGSKEMTAMIKLRSKLLLSHIGLVVLTIAISGIAFKEINSRLLVSKVAQMSDQTNSIIRENVLQTMDTVNNYSKMLLANELIQRNLPKKGDIELSQIREIHLYLLEFLDSAPILSSIYIYDLHGNGHAVGRYRVQSVEFDKIRESGLYDRALEMSGAPVVSVNMNHLLDTKQKENVVSFSRIINSTDTMEPIGFIVVNVEGESLQPSYERIGANQVSYVEILDQDGVLLSGSGQAQPVADEIRTGFLSGEGTENYSVIGSDKTRYMVTSTHIHKYDWTVLSVTPFSEIEKENDYYQFVMLLLLGISVLVMIVGSFLISQSIAVPIKHLVSSMRKISTGHLVPVEFKAGSYEMNVLKDGYNQMVERIETLIERIYDEQKRLRRAELNSIQAQIKPHFLYNSFDAISSLSFAGKSDEVYKLVKSLGTYYRNSLSNGKEVITLGKELEIVKSYVAIQNIRYRGLINLAFDVDQRYIGLPLLKLILQPLVENALYHGIMPKGKNGKVTISAKEDGSWFVIRVADDGVGMNDDQVRMIMNGPMMDEGEGGFGLMNTIQRLQLFYDMPNLLSIESKIGEGTVITIRIPVTARRQDDDGYGDPSDDRG